MEQDEEPFPWAEGVHDHSNAYGLMRHRRADIPKHSTFPWQQKYQALSSPYGYQPVSGFDSYEEHTDGPEVDYPAYSSNNVEERMQHVEGTSFDSPLGGINGMYDTNGYTNLNQQNAYGAETGDARINDQWNPTWTELDNMSVPDIFSLTRHNHYDQVEHLLDAGYSPNLQDGNGNSILHIACQNGLKRIAKLALRRGAEINLQNRNGNTPLHFCFGLSFGETLGAYLISKGANPDMRNNIGMTCYEGFKLAGHSALLAEQSQNASPDRRI